MDQESQASSGIVGLARVIGWAAIVAGAVLAVLGAEEMGVFTAAVSGLCVLLLGMLVVVVVEIASAHQRTASHTHALLTEFRRAEETKMRRSQVQTVIGMPISVPEDGKKPGKSG